MGDVRPGDVIAERFRVERVLEEASTGVLAEAREGDERIALRVLPAPVSAELVLRADSMRKLGGEHLARILDVGRLPDGSVYVVTEWAEGEDLAAMVARGAVPAEEAAEIILQVCDGLAEGHRLNAIHGRLEPSKIVVGKGEDGAPHARVLGWELGTPMVPADPQVRVDRPGFRWLPYASPEMLSSSRATDAQSDVWSLGAMLYEAVTQARPFAGETLGEVLNAVLTTPFKPLASRRADLPRSYTSVAERSLHHDLERRCQDVSDIAAVLAAIAPKRARKIAARVELTLHGTLPSLQRIIRQEQRTEPPAPVARTVSRPPPALVRSTPPPAPEPDGSDSKDEPDPEPPPAQGRAGETASSSSSSTTTSGLSPRVVGGVALAVIAVGGVLATRSSPPPPTPPGTTQPTSATTDAGADADEEPAPMSSRRPGL